MSMADPLEVPETEVVVSALESMQSQITAARTLVAFLRRRRVEANYALVEEQLHKADARLQKNGRNDRSQEPLSRCVKEAIS